MVHAAVECCEPGDILLVAPTAPSTYAMIGEPLASSLAARGVVGIVVDAGVRDVAALRAMGLQAWSSLVTSAGTTKSRPGSVNVPVRVGDVVIAPGDILVADDDGVVAVPAAVSAAVLEAARRRLTGEDEKRRLFAAGVLGVDLYGLREVLAELGVQQATATRRITRRRPMAEPGTPCTLMRGGTSRGAFFLASDLPSDVAVRNAFLARVLGAPDPNEVDGVGGGHPLTSKVAVVEPSADPSADVDYLFLQVWPDTGAVTADQTCGNILAGGGPVRHRAGPRAGGSR